jgi:hypothetical protein
MRGTAYPTVAARRIEKGMRESKKFNKNGAARELRSQHGPAN